MVNTNSLSGNQKKTLKRIYRDRPKNSTTAISPEVARPLIRRGLVWQLGTHQRKEWNKPVKGATLWKVVLTDAGRQFVETLD